MHHFLYIDMFHTSSSLYKCLLLKSSEKFVSCFTVCLLFQRRPWGLPYTLRMTGVQTTSRLCTSEYVDNTLYFPSTTLCCKL
jgi:hypothetical protein